jgi:hypothetical protein
MSFRSLRWVVAGALVMLGTASTARADTLLPFTALLNSAQETPPVSSPSQGVALVTYNTTQKLLCYALSYSPLSSPETVAHFHGPGAPTVSAPVVFAITPSPSPIGSPKQGCVGPLTKPQEKELKKGLYYLNIHTTNFPLGEIRGQVLPEKGSFKNVPTTTTTTPTSTTTTSTIGSPSGAFVDLG